MKTIILTSMLMMSSNIFGFTDQMKKDLERKALEGKTCDYEIEFSAQGVGNERLPNSSLKVKISKAPKLNFNQVGNPFGALKKSAKNCFSKGLSIEGPKTCKGNKKIKVKDKMNKKNITYTIKLSDYNFKKTSLKQAVFNEACRISNLSGNTGKLKKIKIDAKSSNKNCPGFNVAKGLTNVCQKDGSAGREKKDYMNRKSKLYEKSAKDLRKKIKKYCKNTYGMGKNPKIRKYFIDENNGKIGAFYDCVK